MCKHQGQSEESEAGTTIMKQKQQKQPQDHAKRQQQRRRVHFDPKLVIRSSFIEVDEDELDGFDEEEKENPVHCSAKDLKFYRLEAASAVLESRKLYGGDWKRLPCGGRGLEKFANREMASQIQLLKLAVTNAVLGEQSRQRHSAWAKEDYEDDDDDTDALLERIQHVAQQHSRVSVLNAVDLARQDEEYVRQLHKEEEQEEEERKRKKAEARKTTRRIEDGRDDEVCSNNSEATSSSASSIQKQSPPSSPRRLRRHFSLRSSRSSASIARSSPPCRTKSLTLSSEAKAKRKNGGSRSDDPTKGFSIRKTTNRTTRALRQMMGKAAAATFRPQTFSQPERD